jgi:hypothetical protein
MQFLHIGVYGADGRRILRGAETGPRDLYLYDFEVHALADSLARGDRFGPADIAAVLTNSGIVPAADHLDATALAAILRGWAAAAAHVRGGGAKLPLLFRDLGQARHAPVDAASAPGGVHLDALQTFLVEAALFGPALRRASAAHAGGARAGAFLRQAAVPRRPVARTASLCHSEPWNPPPPDEIAGDAVTEKFEDAMGKLIAKAIGKEAEAEIFEQAKSDVGLFLDSLHAALLLSGLHVSSLGGPDQTAFGPAGLSPDAGKPLTFGVHFRFDDDLRFGGHLNRQRVECLALAGLRLPPEGDVPGIRVTWLVGSLVHDGTLDPSPGGLTLTVPSNAQGVAAFTFTPRTELIPGLGDVRTDSGFVHAFHLIGAATGNKLAMLANLIPAQDEPFSVSYHDQSGALTLDSTITDTATGSASGAETYRVTGKVPLPVADPQDTPGSEPFGPPLPQSGSLLAGWDAGGAITQPGEVSCLEPGGFLLSQPFTFTEHSSGEPATGSMAVDRVTLNASQPGLLGPLTVGVRLAPPADTLSQSVDSDGFCAKPIVEGIGQGDSYWNQFFASNHATETADGPCSGACYGITGWQPANTSGGSLATKQYALPATPDCLRIFEADGVDPACVSTAYSETTTFTLRSGG